MFKIGIDIFGGDYNSDTVINGVNMCELPSNVEIVLIGKDIIATDTITMDNKPTNVLKDTKSSISIGMQMLKNKEIDVFISNGNTGAIVVSAIKTLGFNPGITKPCISAFLPNINNTETLLLDIGANVDSSANDLYTFAHLGINELKHIENPRVGLLNIGTESIKGNNAVKNAFKLLSDDSNINFIGNIEGCDIYTNKCDIIVCDGFIGNILIKNAESLYDILGTEHNNIFLEKLNYRNYGGAKLLGINGNVIIGHGKSTSNTIKNTIEKCIQTLVN